MNIQQRKELQKIAKDGLTQQTSNPQNAYKQFAGLQTLELNLS